MKLISFFFLLFTCSACEVNHSNKKLHLSNEQLVQVLIELYSKDAALQLQKDGNIDSLSVLYSDQISKILRVDWHLIEEDLETLLSMPDTLYLIQNLAIDSLRALESGVVSPTKSDTISIE